MDKKDWQGRQEFFDHISSYQYIREDGRLVLEPFCVYLSHCFGFDGILELSPQPRDIYMLLVNLIREHLGDEEAKKKIQFQNISDWDPELAYIFPERRMTCVHVGALVLVSHYWIYDIGHTLMRVPRPENSGKYFAWVKEEWLAVYTFINGYHNEFNKFQKRFDRENISSNGYSLFEASHIARVKSISFDEAKKLLKTRHNSYQVAMGQISKALHEGYYLEAITLEECLISNCLFNFLDALGVKLSNPSFYTLLNEILDKGASAYAFPSELLVDLDKWRKARNNAIHGFISSHNTELTLSGTSFHELSRETAMQGEDYCKSVISWYEVECVNFIRHEFPKEQKNLIVH
ncbi:hypothetical protein [Pseudomonas kulmbachensis]|uniref:Apea-like HEPN domain-containing protein n=1 Tax=Pseudomonas kulmbachensis TaxID=3043408 RepID=A0ABW7LXP6_9PSED